MRLQGGVVRFGKETLISPSSSGAQVWRVVAKQLRADGEGLAEQTLDRVHLETPVQRVQDQCLGRERDGLPSLLWKPIPHIAFLSWRN